MSSEQVFESHLRQLLFTIDKFTGSMLASGEASLQSRPFTVSMYQKFYNGHKIYGKLYKLVHKRQQLLAERYQVDDVTLAKLDVDRTLAKWMNIYWRYLQVASSGSLKPWEQVQLAIHAMQDAILTQFTLEDAEEDDDDDDEDEEVVIPDGLGAYGPLPHSLDSTVDESKPLLESKSFFSPSVPSGSSVPSGPLSLPKTSELPSSKYPSYEAFMSNAKFGSRVSPPHDDYDADDDDETTTDDSEYESESDENDAAFEAYMKKNHEDPNHNIPNHKAQ